MKATFPTVLILGVATGFTTGCGSRDVVGPSVAEIEARRLAQHTVVAPIEETHNKAAYLEKQAVKANFSVDFGGDAISGTMWFTPSLGSVRMVLDNGDVVVWDGQNVWATGSTPEGAPDYRFHAKTWPYFMAAPFKLRDLGVTHTIAPDTRLTSRTAVHASKMTFGSQVGDAPDDWYLVFPSAEGSLMALAYVNTYDQPVEQAQNHPSIVFYRDPVTIDGVTFASEWVFHNWDPQAGVTGAPKGRASLTDIKFVAPPHGAFDKPSGAFKIKPPKA